MIVDTTFHFGKHYVSALWAMMLFGAVVNWLCTGWVGMLTFTY